MLATKPKEKHFTVSTQTLWFDKFMTQFVKVGGISIIVVVFGIFVFILLQVFPLFKQAEVEKIESVSIPTDIGELDVLGMDEWSELPFLLKRDGRFYFFDLVGDRGLITKRAELSDKMAEVTVLNYNQKKQEVIFGSSNGYFQVVQIGYKPEFTEEGERLITVSLKSEKPFLMGREGAPISAIDFQDYEYHRLVVGIQDTQVGRELHAVRFVRKRSLIAKSSFRLQSKHSLSHLLSGEPLKPMVNNSADALVVSDTENEVHFLTFNQGKFALQQTFSPFKDSPDATIASMDFLFGKGSICFTSRNGDNIIFSLFRSPVSEQFEWGHTKTFPPLSGPANLFVPSLRNRAFLVGSGPDISLRFSTTSKVRWQTQLPFTPQTGIISGKFDTILLLDEANTFHLYSLHDPHPEAGFEAFWQKIWYEGYPEKAYIWQSTGGSDEFEPKLSLVPLIFGSIKGTLYAMLFALPISLLAAVYTSRFLKPELKRIVKPVMEIMASLPSVVLGFIAALWLAPLIENKIPSILLTLVMTPFIPFVLGWIWIRLPIRYRILIKPGWEFVILLPLLLVGGYLCWNFGPALEQMLFVITDPNSGERVADFRLWWPEFTGTSFDQRNSLVVGFIMGFAVIPIIFTIAEDSLSNVPQPLVSGSLALGASRWQTIWSIVLPTALPGIFSAFMIGLGRAVGETMIVVMATGNTPLMEWNIFSGFRALSANIAVELPEAPQHGTLYRTLFLGAMVLFVLTFFVNTIAEVVRQRLRSKYKSLG